MTQKQIILDYIQARKRLLSKGDGLTAFSRKDELSELENFIKSLPEEESNQVDAFHEETERATALRWFHEMTNKDASTLSIKHYDRMHWNVTADEIDAIWRKETQG